MVKTVSPLKWRFAKDKWSDPYSTQQKQTLKSVTHSNSKHEQLLKTRTKGNLQEIIQN